MKVRKFRPLLVAALLGVVTLAVAGTGAARVDVAEQEPYKVVLVTDIGGLDDRSFNFLANKGLNDAKKRLGVQGKVLISRSDRDYIPNLTSAVRRDGADLVIGVGFLMADALAKVAKRFPDTKFAIVDNSGVGTELKNGNPTNVRGLLFKEQEAGYLVGYIAGLRAKNAPAGQQVVAAVGGLKIPPVDRFIAGYYVGAKKAFPAVKVEHSYSQDFVDQAKCKEAALSHIANGASVVFQVAGQCGLGVLSAAKERNRFGIGVDADQGYLGNHVLTSATKRVDIAVSSTIAAAEAGGAKFKTNFNAIFSVKTNGVGYGKISSRAQPSWRKAIESVRKQIASGKIKVTAQSPPASGSSG
ncbi:MAG: BMP family ABC transporter substrate-binding protein [Actinomycetota bacterium]|nr:BMP family ABC transporter substrate-binding protein [Actinomycetota bacterium]